MVIEKYYSPKGRLKKLDKKIKEESIFRFKILKNGKEFPCCDFHGICTNKAYAEVFPGFLKKDEGWYYLCKKHYYQEQKRLNNKLPACLQIDC